MLGFAMAVSCRRVLFEKGGFCKFLNRFEYFLQVKLRVYSGNYLGKPQSCNIRKIFYPVRGRHDVNEAPLRDPRLREVPFEFRLSRTSSWSRHRSLVN